MLYDLQGCVINGNAAFALEPGVEGLNQHVGILLPSSLYGEEDKQHGEATHRFLFSPPNL